MNQTIDPAVVSAHPVPAYAQTLAGISFTSAVLTLVLLLALHALRPDLAPSWRMVSEYANGPYGWMMALCFLGLSVGCASLLVALLAQVPALCGRIGLGFLFMAAIGLAMASIYPTDPVTISPAEASPAGKMHGLSALIGIPSFVIAAALVSIGLLANPLWGPVRWPVIVFANLGWISLVLLAGVAMILLPRHGGFGPQVPIGWPNRLLVFAWVGWLMAASWPMMTSKPTV